MGGGNNQTVKANQFAKEDNAVSPVIAVILMVAITVVLAATVFVLVQDVGSNTSKTQPSVGWAESEVDDQWDVNQAPQQVQYEAYQIKVVGATATTDATELVVQLNADPASNLAVEEDYIGLSGTGWDNEVMTGGDFLQFCDTDPLTVEENIKVTLLHTESNSVANEYTFLTVDTAC
jgi:flagellin-like protein